MEYHDGLRPGHMRPSPRPRSSWQSLGVVRLTDVAAVLLSAGSGIAIWVGVLPDSGSIGGFYLPLMCAVAFAITFALRVEPSLVPLALVIPQLAIVSLSPPGDNSGLQLLWYPFLTFILLVLMLPAGLGRWLRDRQL